MTIETLITIIGSIIGFTLAYILKERIKGMNIDDISIDDIEHLMNYQSPVQLAINKWTDEIIKQEDNCIMAQIKHQIGVEVDKDELIKALDYDREQYSKGFKNGYDKRDSEIVRCKDCNNTFRQDGFLFCKQDKYIATIVDDNDYCSNGERKDNA